MIITNWPDKCPRCNLVTFVVSRDAKPAITTSTGAVHTSKYVEFKCAGIFCDHRWTLELVSVDPVVYFRKAHAPMAVVADSAETADAILALDDTWARSRLSELISRGAARSVYVLEQTELAHPPKPEPAKPRASKIIS